MANHEHVEMLRQGAETWNDWRRCRAPVFISLRNADLRNLELVTSYTVSSSRPRAGGFYTYSVGADLSEADLTGADLSGAILDFANFRGAQLTNASLKNAVARRTDFSHASVDGLELGNTIFQDCIFGGLDLRKARGLASARHLGPSTLGTDTILLSDGQIPEAFLRGCGVPEELIVQIPALVNSITPIQFNSCFISYNHQDEDFARRLHSRMQSDGLRVWYAPEEMRGGRKLHEQIFSAIQMHDKLLVVLSEESMSSAWVATEVRRAQKVEREQNRRKLFPVRLVDFEKIQKWECFDADIGKDLAVELREYFIPDFSKWKNHDAFETSFARLLKDLKAEADRA
jgi:hypothetical protein